MWKTPAEQAARCLTYKFQSNKVNQTAGQGNVLNQMNQGAMGHSFNESILDHLIFVLDIVLLCAQQDIPLHWHKENYLHSTEEPL